jgi:hypothetical protein
MNGDKFVDALLLCLTLILTKTGLKNVTFPCYKFAICRLFEIHCGTDELVRGVILSNLLKRKPFANSLKRKLNAAAVKEQAPGKFKLWKGDTGDHRVTKCAYVNLAGESVKLEMCSTSVGNWNSRVPKEKKLWDTGGAVLLSDDERTRINSLLISACDTNELKWARMTAVLNISPPYDAERCEDLCQIFESNGSAAAASAGDTGVAGASGTGTLTYTYTCTY